MALSLPLNKDCKKGSANENSFAIQVLNPTILRSGKQKIWKDNKAIHHLVIEISYFLQSFVFLKSLGTLQAGRFDDAKEVINNIWGPTEVKKAIEEFQSVIMNDSADLDSSWLELLQEPHSRGYINVILNFMC